MLVLVVVFNIGMLFFFKYTDFFITNINALLGTSIPLLHLTLPLGISFYTFQTMSYTLDVYKGTVQPERNIIDLGAYVVMFPQLIAGPIVLYKDVAAQLKVKRGRYKLCRDRRGHRACSSSVWAKKCCWPTTSARCGRTSSCWATTAYPPPWPGWALSPITLQIYFDFSGYSTMAIGLGKMLGFNFPENFNLPYISRSITEFWRRWHMTLSGWFREYVYIPLGGNRRGLPRQIFNLFVVWTLTGFWHGANWNFLLWGFYYFVLLAVEKLFLYNMLQRGRVWPHLYALLLHRGRLGAFCRGHRHGGYRHLLLAAVLAAGRRLGALFRPQLRRRAADRLLCSTPLPRRFYAWVCKKSELLRILVLAAVLLRLGGLSRRQHL